MKLLAALLFAVTLAAADGAIGVGFQADPSPGVLLHFGGATEGVLITETIPNGPAEKAGLRLGDVVVAIDGMPVTGPEELRELAAELVPGKTAEITFRRRKHKADGHDEKTVTVDVVDRATFAGYEPAEPAEPEEKP